MNPTYSLFEFTGTGAVQQLPVPEYLDRSHIQVWVNGARFYSFTWLNPATISLTAPAGAQVVVRRATSPAARLVSFREGVGVTPEALEADSRQAFFMGQEALDVYTRVADLASAPLSDPAAAVVQASLARDAAIAAAAAAASQAAAAGQVTANLANSSVSTLGAGMVAFGAFTQYPRGSVGHALQAGDLHLDWFVPDPNDATAGWDQAMAILATRGGRLILGRKTYTRTPFQIPNGVTIQGQGAYDPGGSPDEDETGATVVRIDSADGTWAIDTSARRGWSLKDFKLVQPSATKRGRGVGGVDAYFGLLEGVLIEGYGDGIQADKALYWRLDRVRCSAGLRGATFTGPEGTWNVQWFNNAITIVDSQFNGNEVSGLDCLGVNVQLITTGAEKVANSGSAPTAGIAVQIRGQSGMKAQATIIGPYIEQSWQPFVFDRADVTVVDGYVQGWGAAPAGTSLFRLRNGSRLRLVGTLRTADLFQWQFDLTGGSVVEAPELPAVASVSNLDATSRVVLTGHDSGTAAVNITGCSPAPSGGTAVWELAGRRVTLYLPSMLGTSNSGSLTVTGVPASLWPTSRTARGTLVIFNDGAPSLGYWSLDPSGNLTILRAPAGAAAVPFTASGAKGVQETTLVWLRA